jgi:uncharacterized protein (TIGR02996 family)
MNVVAVALGQEIGPYKVIRADAALPVVRDIDEETNPTEWRIRVLSPVRSDIVARFVEENRALRTLQVPVLAVVDANSYMTLASNQRRNTIAYVVYACSSRARPLAEYLVRGPIPPDDVTEIVRRIAHALAVAHDSQLVHGSLSPQTVTIDPHAEGDEVRLIDFGRALSATPTRDPILDARGLGNLVFAMLAGTSGADRGALDGWIERLLGPRPPRMRELADALGPPRSFVLERGGYQPTDKTERALFEQLDVASDDARLVYADWLEEHGDVDRAALLRGEPELPEHDRVEIAKRTPPGWRLAVARAPVARCGLRFGTSCTKRWDAMTRTEHDDVRHCGSCDQPIYYCATLDEAAYRGGRRECIAIDAALVVETASAIYDDAVPTPAEVPPFPDQPQMWVGLVMPQPPPQQGPLSYPSTPEPEPRGLLDRIGGWFRRKR